MQSLRAPGDHSFHVPVMGIGFTIDTPIRLAPLGIDSSISLVNDDVIEVARAYHCRLRLLPYQRIDTKEPDARARRITEYLNLVDRLVQKDFERMRASSFDAHDGIRRYFELLPEQSFKRRKYLAAEAMPEGEARERARDELRSLMVPGTIGVNIMTKLDGATDEKGDPREAHGSDAQAALRGFARSTVQGPLILSAGANPGLFAYLADFDDFFPDAAGVTKKTIVLKVSDFRSAHVQGRMLTRRGIWVGEYRIESGLNCGGHAFPTDGLVMGPILQEFKERRAELTEGLFAAYQKGLASRNITPPDCVPQTRISAQGGIGTASEDRFLREHFGLDRTGWGSPFLMVPEAVILDPRTMDSLVSAKKDDVELTWSSPLGVRFWWLKTCESEEARTTRIEEGFPGSVCTARHLALNNDYGKVPLCTGSRAYQKRKKAELDPAHPDYDLIVKRLEAPACICVDLCGSYLACTSEEKAPPPAICPGPNIINFQKKLTLEEMVGHIYGRTDVLTRADRPHMFIREVELYIDVFDEDLEVLGTAVQSRTADQLAKTLAGLAEGIAFYQMLKTAIAEEERAAFSEQLTRLSSELEVRSHRLAQSAAKRTSAPMQAAAEC